MPATAMPAQTSNRTGVDQRQCGDGRGEAAQHDRRLAADDHQPKLARQRDAQRGQQQAARRAARCSGSKTNFRTRRARRDRGSRPATAPRQQQKHREQDRGARSARPTAQRPPRLSAGPDTTVGRRRDRAGWRCAGRVALRCSGDRAVNPFDQIVAGFELDRGFRKAPCRPERRRCPCCPSADL